jgi:hypothetical protein
MNSKKKNNEVEVALQLENETWLPVEMNQAYEISHLGRLRRNDKILTPSSNGGKRKYKFYMIGNVKVYVHHLVLKTFVGEKEEGQECDHIDGNPSNNALTNLRWCTIAENRSHKGERHPSCKLNNQKVLLIRMLWAMNKGEVKTQKKLSQLFEISASALSCIIRRKTWAHI